MEPIITIKGMSKKYNITHQQGGYVALRDILAETAKHPFKFLKDKTKKVIRRETREEFWALKNISFTVNKGEAVGIIGANGAGKSTLLKILSKITPPTEGTIEYKGTMSSLLEVGTGFHPELTGRENIFLNGAILGMTKKEIVEKFDDIVMFSGVGKFLDMQVKRYSSGMSVRLAFAVAAHMEPDILVVDEVLAVGDAEFQKKCLGKMDEVTKKYGRTILFVSHNLPAVQSLCKRCILIEAGEIKMIGDTKDVIARYLKLSQNGPKRVGPYKTNIDNFYIENIKLINRNKSIYNQPLEFELILTSAKPINNILIGLQITNSQLVRIMTAKVDIPKMDVGKNKLHITIENPYLPPGNYNLNAGIGVLGNNVFYKTHLLPFEISTEGIEDMFAISKKDILGVYPPVSYVLEKIEK